MQGSPGGTGLLSIKQKRFLFEWWKVCMRMTEGPCSWRKHSFGAWGMIKETLECITMWLSVTSNCHLFKKFQSHQKPNADFVQERNDQVYRLRKAWSSQIFLFWVLRSCKFRPTKPLGLCEGFEITLTNAFDSVFLHSKNWNWWFTDWEVSENQNQWLSTKWNTCPTLFETHNPDLR